MLAMEEHEVYGGKIPEYEPEDTKMGINEKELDVMRKMLHEIEEEETTLRETQAKVAQEMQIRAMPDTATSAVADQASREEVDSRSIFVGNVDYSCTPEEVQHYFQSCGTVNRVTIKTDKFGQPKGFAYVEFLDAVSVQNALRLNNSELHNRPLKITAKRTNVPGMGQQRYRGRRFNPYAPPSIDGYGYGKMPRYRRPIRYRPYYY